MTSTRFFVTVGYGILLLALVATCWGLVAIANA